MASGPGCGGGWTAVLAYSYADGPDKTYAPDYLATWPCYDGDASVPAGATARGPTRRATRRPVRTARNPASTSSVVRQRPVVLAQRAEFRTAPRSLDRTGVTGITTGTRTSWSTTPVARRTRQTRRDLGVTAASNGFVAGYSALTTPLAVKVNLVVAT